MSEMGDDWVELEEYDFFDALSPEKQALLSRCIDCARSAPAMLKVLKDTMPTLSITYELLLEEGKGDDAKFAWATLQEVRRIVILAGGPDTRGGDVD